ncbi:MAG: hypothetical protein IKZ14_09845 [Muribaculaceae bacterium]|nr:hypothetical protein [Muribaculaceae bacterium]
MEETTDTTQQQSPKHRKSVAKRIFKVLGWTIVSLLLLIVIALASVVWILSPERLTPIVNDVANKFVNNSQVNVERVELTFWRSFPQLRVDIDSLTVTSHVLDSIDQSIVPADHSQLLSIGHFHGGVNVVSLIKGKIEVYDVELYRPAVNIVALNDSVTNFDIFPPSAPDTTASEPITSLPEIALDRFVIADALPIRYRALADSIDAGIIIKSTQFEGNNAPQYTLSFIGNASALLPPTVIEPDVPVGINGSINWNPANPLCISVSDFDINIAELNSTLNASLDLSQQPTVNALDFKINRLSLADAMTHVPAAYKKPLEIIKTDLTVSIGAVLTKPYVLTDSVLPSLDATINLHEGHLTLGNSHKPLTISADVAANIIGNNLDASVIKVKSCKVNGASIKADLNATLTSVISDPAIKGHFDGNIYFNSLPAVARRLIPGKVTGSLDANTSVDLRLSHISKTGFHKAKLKGQASLRNFTFTDSTTDFYTRTSTFRFGNNNSFVRDNHRVDSMLTASVKIDTASVAYSGMKVRIKDFLAGIGCKNDGTILDSTTVTPIGGTIKISSLVFSCNDSMRVRLRDIKCRASLRRFNDNAKVPQLSLSMDANRISYGDPLNRLNLSGGKIDLTAHIRPRRQMSPRIKARFDSIAQANPDLSADSVYRLMMPRRQVQATVQSNDEILDFALDNSAKDLLRRWNITGSISAKRGRVFTPYFPLRNSLSDVNVALTTDSVIFRNIKYKVGRSDFRINGRIDNIRRALTSRTGRTPLELNLHVSSDTIDVNQLAEAAFAGAAFAEKAKSGNIVITNTENEDSLQAAMEQLTDTSTMAAILIPKNLTASFSMRARNIMYADMHMTKFRGSVMMRNGAINMHKLSAATDMGSIDLSALYNAPDKQNMNFGFGLQIKELQLDRVLHMLPAVDSIMPMMKNFDGIINADIAATSDIDSTMNFVLPSLNAAIKLYGDSLVLLDADTFKMLSKWLMFKNKKDNIINNVGVEILVENSMLELFPFMFDIDRYRLGVMGHNDMAFNFDYHVSVLKSPLPFKFGLNASGNPDDMKIRVGKAKFKENMVTKSMAIVDTTRINLLNQIENVFRRGVKLGKMQIDRKGQSAMIKDNVDADTISHADSLLLIREGLLPQTAVPTTDSTQSKSKKRKK